MKRWTVLFLVAILTVPLFAQGSGPIYIGAVYPLSGSLAPIGTNCRRGIDFAVEEINSKGGVLGRQIEIIYGDSVGDPKTGMAEAERLITTKNVVALIGAYQSAVTNVVSEVAQRYKVPMITAISTADPITTRGYQYFFRLAPTNMMYLRDMIQYSYDVSQKFNLGYKTVGFITDNTLLGQESLKWGKYWAKEIGFTVVKEIQYSNNTVDLSSEVLTIKRANPDILVVDPYISDAILLTKTLHEQGFAPHIMIGKASGLIDPSFIPAVKDLATGITTALEWNTDIPKAQETNKRFMAKFNINMNGHSAETYTTIKVMAQAFKLAGSVDREKVRDTLATLVIDKKFSDGSPIILPYEMIDFENFTNEAGSHTNQNKYARITIGQIKNGKYVTVWPFDSAAEDPILSLKKIW
ncbi:MAG: ABC transporter substrate-binding protein [Spirochaetes bacterium]|nr:ABC transporter substrate-binding protein [Spirochaetota bacterium]